MMWMDDVEDDVVDARYSLFNELNAELVRHQCRPPTSVCARMTWCRLGLRR